MEPLLTVENLEVRYASHQALFGASVTVPEGSLVAVLGANGAGKSTLARAISGLVPISGGRVHLAGRDITTAKAHEISRMGLVYVPEGRGIFRGLTVYENLRMATRRAGDTQHRKDALERAYTLFPILGQRRGQRAGSLSGGEQQMLALSVALAVTPRLLIADEMSLGLAPLVVEDVFQALAKARESGVTVLLIEQFVHRALALAQECMILRQGRTVWHGPASAAGDTVLERYLGDTEDTIQANHADRDIPIGTSDRGNT